MKHAIAFDAFATPRLGADVGSALSVVVAYEDFERGTHAKTTCDFLAQSLGKGWKISNQMWKFSVLEIEALREMAARDAAAADIIMVSLHCGSALPEPVRHWIEGWAGQARNATALVALFDGPSEAPPGTPDTRAWLAEAARRAGLEFFAQPAGAWAQPVAGRATPSTITDVVGYPKLALAGVLPQPARQPHWGINE